MAKLKIADLTEKHYAMIATAKLAPEWTLTEQDFSAKDFKPLVRLDLFREYYEYETAWTMADVTAETLPEFLNSPHSTFYKLTELGNKVHHDKLYKWYTENHAPANITSLWDDAPIQTAQIREPYKSPKQLAAEAKLKAWNAKAGKYGNA